MHTTDHMEFLRSDSWTLTCTEWRWLSEQSSLETKSEREITNVHRSCLRLATNPVRTATMAHWKDEIGHGGCVSASGVIYDTNNTPTRCSIRLFMEINPESKTVKFYYRNSFFKLFPFATPMARSAVHVSSRWWWWWIFPRLWEFSGKVSRFIPCLPFFKMWRSARANQFHFWRSWSVHSG